MSFFERLFCQAPLKLVVEQQNEISQLIQGVEIHKQAVKEIQDKYGESEEAQFWNNKWKKNKVIYRAQDGLKRDVRNIIFSKSYILEPESAKLRKSNHDDTMLAILKAVKKRLRYTDDNTTHDQPEYWQSPEETWQTKKGDCEDGALLILSLGLMCGVPAYKLKLCAGWVINNGVKTGHAYCIYLSDGQWFILDWCYWYSDSIRNFKKVPHKKQATKYKDIWWTANNQYTWAQKSTELK